MDTLTDVIAFTKEKHKKSQLTWRILQCLEVLCI